MNLRFLICGRVLMFSETSWVFTHFYSETISAKKTGIISQNQAISRTQTVQINSKVQIGSKRFK